MFTAAPPPLLGGNKKKRNVCVFTAVWDILLQPGTAGTARTHPADCSVQLQQQSCQGSRVLCVGAAKMFTVAGANSSCRGAKSGSHLGQATSSLQGHSQRQTSIHAQRWFRVTNYLHVHAMQAFEQETTNRGLSELPLREPGRVWYDSSF